jgi:hypothetical protein
MEKLKREIKKLGLITIFFFLSFAYVLLIMKLLLKGYAITFYAFPKTLVGSLAAAKVVAVMDLSPWMNMLRDFPRYISVIYKTFIYTAICFALGMVERFLHSYMETKQLSEAIRNVLATENFYHFFAFMLCMAVVFFLYNIWKELEFYLGKQKFLQILFEIPRNKLSESS